MNKSHIGALKDLANSVQVKTCCLKRDRVVTAPLTCPSAYAYGYLYGDQLVQSGKGSVEELIGKQWFYTLAWQCSNVRACMGIGAGYFEPARSKYLITEGQRRVLTPCQ
eukprot:scaffold53282_cov31-Tisochrysis_lutea.AAC.1